MATYMKEKDVRSCTEGLAGIFRLIDELSPQCPVDFRTDFHKVYSLKREVAEFSEWSTSPIQEITKPLYSFNSSVRSQQESIKTHIHLKRFRLNFENDDMALYTTEPVRTYLG